MTRVDFCHSERSEESAFFLRLENACSSLQTKSQHALRKADSSLLRRLRGRNDKGKKTLAYGSLHCRILPWRQHHVRIVDGHRNCPIVLHTADPYDSRAPGMKDAVGELDKPPPHGAFPSA